MLPILGMCTFRTRQLTLLCAGHGHHQDLLRLLQSHISDNSVSLFVFGTLSSHATTGTAVEQAQDSS